MQPQEAIFVTGVLGPLLLGIALLVTQRLISGRERYHDDVLNLARA